ncbi:unnamed protein product [Chrysoparadoxa australica]
MTQEDRIVVKRPAEDEGSNEQKRMRPETLSALAVVQKQGITRTSSLLAPTMLLTGHEAAVYTVQFDPSGRNLASAGVDKKIMLWEVQGECPNYNVLEGHKNAILDLHWAPDAVHLVTCSADKTVAYWDANAGKRVRSFKEHKGIVNSCAISRDGNLLASGSDDGTMLLFDPRARRAAGSIEDSYNHITAVALSSDASQLFAGGIDETIKSWDVTKGAMRYELKGHSGIVTGVSVSPDGTKLLSNSMDKTLRTWDVRPFPAAGRELKTLQGAMHGAEKTLLRCSWSGDGDMVAAGSSDRSVHIWDEPTGEELYLLPGHSGPVNEVSSGPPSYILLTDLTPNPIARNEAS